MNRCPRCGFVDGSRRLSFCPRCALGGVDGAEAANVAEAANAADDWPDLGVDGLITDYPDRGAQILGVKGLTSR